MARRRRDPEDEPEDDTGSTWWKGFSLGCGIAVGMLFVSFVLFVGCAVFIVSTLGDSVDLVEPFLRPTPTDVR